MNEQMNIYDDGVVVDDDDNSHRKETSLEQI